MIRYVLFYFILHIDYNYPYNPASHAKQAADNMGFMLSQIRPTS
jgi:hypothetical protein